MNARPAAVDFLTGFVAGFSEVKTASLRLRLCIAFLQRVPPMKECPACGNTLIFLASYNELA